MAFHNVILPFRISYGSRVNIQTLSNITESASGARFVNSRWDKFRWSCDLKYTLQDQTDYEELRNFFLLRNGNEHTFRVYDESDHSMTLNDQGAWDDVEETSETLNAFQIHQVITDGTYTYSRKITKPITDTLEVYVGGTTAGYKKTVNTHYTINYDTGLVTWTTGNVPGDSDHVYITCNFHIHAQFVNSEMPASFAEYGVYDFDDIPIIEVKE